MKQNTQLYLFYTQKLQSVNKHRILNVTETTGQWDNTLKTLWTCVFSRTFYVMFGTSAMVSVCLWRSCTLLIGVISQHFAGSLPIIQQKQKQTVKLFGNIFHHTVAQSFKVYQHQTFSQNSDAVTTYRGAKYRWGTKTSRFSTNTSLYLANDTR